VQKIKPAFSDIIFIIAFLLALVSGSQMLNIDSDLGRHLTLGNYILDNRVIPTHDLLSHTKTGLPRPPYEWLSQVIFAIAYRLLNLDGVILLTATVIATTFSLLYKYSYQRSGSPTIAVLITFLAMGASTLHWLPRPHIITFLLLAIWVEHLDKLANEEATSKRYTLPIIMLFWANLHGGFIFAILAWIAYFAGWLWELLQGKSNQQIGVNLFIAGTASLIATVITPDLWHNWDAVLNNRSAFILNRTVETMRPNLADPSVLPYTSFLVLVIFFFAVNRSTIKVSHLFLLIGLGIMSILMARNIPLFVIAGTPILSTMINNYLFRYKNWKQIDERFSGFETNTYRFLLPVTVSLIAIVYFAMFNFKRGHSLYDFDRTVFPVSAASYIHENQQDGNMFNEFNWGGYLLFKLYPQNTVFLDSQTDFYGESLLREYDQIISTRGNWIPLLEKYQVNWAIVPSDSPLAASLQNELNWNIVYQDTTATILRKPD
jgi:hypothetical protein